MRPVKGFDPDRKKLILRLASKGLSQKEISEILEVTPTTVRNYMREMGMLDPKKVMGGIRGHEERLAKQG